MAVIFKSLQGYGAGFIAPDLIAGLTLAAIAVPEQMATARLAQFPPQFGFYAFLAGAVGFALFGASRFMSVGADSTIAPIFAGALALIVAAHPAAMPVAAAALALMVGLWLLAAGLFEMGFIADLLSVPVTTGFLAGVSLHILVSQLPTAFGAAEPTGTMPQKLLALARDVPHINPWPLALAFGVLATIFICERISPRIPGALLALVGATLVVLLSGAQSHGVTLLGLFSGKLPQLSLPLAAAPKFVALVPLSVIIAMVVMVQTAATTRSFPPAPGVPPDVNQDFIGVGAGNILSGLLGSFAIDASPPRTAIVAETGGRSQVASLFAALIVLVVMLFGASLLAHIPRAALAGILIFVALRILRTRVMADIFQHTRVEFLLMLATFAAIIVLPIERGVGVGIGLSLLNGLWNATQARALAYLHVPGTTIWWPQQRGTNEESLPGILVAGFQAPLTFLNAYSFRRDILQLVATQQPPAKLLVLEAGAMLDIDFTAAQIFAALIRDCQARGITFAVARMESLRAQAALQRYHITDLLGPDRLFHSVDEAIKACKTNG
ncbi:MAG: SulP family inorganic anion transporter [Hyphomicrobiales bacterium]|nr:SulP family inorganic anion transporter [Hyphomicrobiales bacterium]